MLAPGTPAPDFTLKTKTPSGLQDVSLGSFRGRKVVLLFFPAAFTGVCTTELCGASQFEGFDPETTTVLGISADSPFAQEAWAKANGITVTLLSDYKREVIAAYDVVWPDLAGLGPSAARASFVIDREGVIRYADQTPTPGDAPDFDAIRAALDALA